MSQKRVLVNVGVIAIVLGIISLGPAWAQGTTTPSDPTETITLKIDGWTCSSCEKDIRKALLAVPGVKAADVSYNRGGAVVTIEPAHVSSDQLVQAVANISTPLSTYHASVIPNGSLPESGTSTGGLGDLLKGVFK